VSLADEFLSDAGVQAGKASSVADQFMADAQGASPADLPRKQLQPVQPLSWMEKAANMVPNGLANNPAVSGVRNFVTAAASPTIGAAQLIANMMPDSTGVPQSYNQKIAAVLKKDAAAAQDSGPFAAGANRLAGGMASPINLVMGARAAEPAITAGQRALQGAGIGAVGGATTPVEVGESGKYWGQKGAQTAIGAAGGAVLAPVLGAVGDRVMAKMNGKALDPALAAKNADQIIESALKDSGQSVDDLPAGRIEALRKQAADSLKSGKQLDIAAALRKGDFEAEGIDPLMGWITRDPKQWAEEQNVRGVTGVGEPVTERIATGNAKLTKAVTQYGANAQEVPVASQTLADALRTYDTGKSADVTAAYTAARQSSGKDLDVPLEGLAQEYAKTLDTFGDKVPKALQAKFAALGLDPANPSNQKKVFTFESADKLLKDINSHVGVDKPTDTALGQLRAAVKGAVTSADAEGGPFAPAVKLAAARFKQLDEIPALDAASTGKVDDTFVQKYVLNSRNTPQVQRLAALLKEQAPEAFQETRQQIGAELARKAFGENVSGDKLMAQESYNRALRNIGTGKLEAFFEPDEIEQMKRLGRLGANVVSPPAGSASNYSSTSSALANLLRKGAKIPVAGQSLKYGGDYLVARNALSAETPVTPNLTLEQRRAMSRALLAITGGAAATLPGAAVGQGK
jgi:hypothetical protein